MQPVPRSCSAAHELQSKHGINYSLTLMFSQVQAIAAAEGGAFLISSLVSRILDCFVLGLISLPEKGPDTRSIVEPTGALTLAGLKKYAAEHQPSTPTSSLCAILSGANMDFDRLRFVAGRARLGEGNEVLLSMIVPDQPKVFNSMIQCILPRPVIEFSYRFGNQTKPLSSCPSLCRIEIRRSRRYPPRCHPPATFATLDPDLVAVSTS
ncbi:hypothetical protein BZA05DRAFT_421318 [Tricharina praecox]|uniref:uncharacterized protein n=1 Tax=Tricharina praecox TaxID=43433 RepID=UPI0022203FBE|nr:uncharacterized protein BZA05DRAFT_421318 [Tricharina praecox]KAI5845490.1 hypothetical protein BZA05DRAFT_421318 [Tricharina praecox]